MKSLHDEIMDIKSKVIQDDTPIRLSYRHAAAELANDHEALMGELLEAFEAIIYAARDADIPYAQLSPHLTEPAVKAIIKAKGEVND